jgi:hypothetical protein
MALLLITQNGLSFNVKVEHNKINIMIEVC